MDESDQITADRRHADRRVNDRAFSDDRETIEIQADLTDDTFFANASGNDKVNVRIKYPYKLKLGLVILAISFIMSLVLTPALFVIGGAQLGAECYLASWGVMGIGILIGGAGAKKIVMGWRVKFKNAVTRGGWRR